MMETFEGKSPNIDKNTFIHKSATIIGDVEIGAKTSVWPGAAIRADINQIKIGGLCSIQDNVCIHVETNNSTTLGDGVTIGHGAMLHACTIGDYALIGIGAIVLDKAVVGDHCIIAAGTVVPPGKTIPSGSMVMGSPGKVTRELTREEQEHLEDHAKRYWKLAQRFIGGNNGQEP